MKPARRLLPLLLLLTLCALPALPVAGAEYHVDQRDGNDTNSGLSWSAALATVGQALTLASVSPGADTVRVARGTYGENLLVPSEVTLEGGYPTGGGARNPAANPTVLDGGGAESVVIIGPNATGVTIDGFEITGGAGLLGGGGIYAETSLVTIRNNVIHDNTVPTSLGRGGGIALMGPLPSTGPSIVTDNEIRDNGVQDGNGGGIAVFDDETGPGAPVQITRNLITGNVARGEASTLGRGGGIYIASNASIIDDNRVLNNQAVSEGSILQTGNGGGILIVQADAVVTRNEIRGNLARGAGGTYSGSGGGIYGNRFSGEITDNQIVANRAEGADGLHSAFGGGIFVYSGTPSITGNLIQGNVLDGTGCSSGRGGGVYLSLAPTTFQDNRVLGNENYREGQPGDGACWDAPGCDCFIGGGIWSYQILDGLHIEGNRFEGNVAGRGGAIILNGSTTTTMEHNQIRYNEAPDVFSAGIEVFWGDVVLFNNEIVENVGDGIVLVGDETDPSVAVLLNVTIADNGLNCPGPLATCGIGLYTVYGNGLDIRNSIIFGNGLSDWIDWPDANNDPTTTIWSMTYTDVGDNIFPGAGNIALDPLFARGPYGSHYLGSLATGQGADSPCLDTGGDMATSLNLEDRTTRSDDWPDQGTVDMGFHYPRFNTSGAVLLWEVGRVNMDLRLRFSGQPGADGHRIYRGELGRLRTEYSHQSPFTGTGAECNVALPQSFIQFPDAMAETGDFYYLVVPLTGGVEGSFGQADLDGDGVPDGERTRPEDSGTDDVRNNCP